MRNHPYDWWSSQIGDRQIAERTGDVTMVPQPGFYRARRGGVPIPVAYYAADGEVRCRIGDEDVDATRAAEIWPYASKTVISEALYRAVAEDGGKWPDIDTNATPASGDNMPPPADSVEAFRDQINSAREGLSAYAKIGLTFDEIKPFIGNPEALAENIHLSDEEATRAQTLRARLLELSGAVIKKHKVEKEPHLAAGRAVDQTWFPLRDLAQQGADAIRAAMTAWNDVKLAVQREQERRQAAAEREAKKVGTPAPAAAPSPVFGGPIKGAVGRAASVKVVKVAVVTDQAKAYAYLAQQPEVIEAIQKAAQRFVDGGSLVPGVKIEETADVR
jgi:hypothetical protein